MSDFTQGSDEFVDAFFEAALWSSNDESDESGGEPMDANYFFQNGQTERPAKGWMGLPSWKGRR